VCGLLFWPRPSVSGPSLSAFLESREPRNEAFGRYEQGNRYFRQGKYGESEREYRFALKISPGQPDFLNMLAYAVAEQGRLDDALETAKAALKAAPDNWMIIDTVAEMYQRREQYATAAAYYEQALQGPRNPEKAETHCKYGETLIGLGRREEAVFHLQQGAAAYDPRWAVRSRQALQSLGVEVKPIYPGGPMAGRLRAIR
jgi:tetratricopeptide (TPR) repeat protein